MSSSAIDIFGNQADNFKNKIINGNFDFWQRMRGTASAYQFPSNGVPTGVDITAFVADRWFVSSTMSGSDTYVANVQRQEFAAGQNKIQSLPTYYCNFSGVVTESGGTATQVSLAQRIENVKTFAGKQVTVSFWIKGSVDGYVSFRVNQKFGSGGSPSTAVNVGQRQFELATTWTQQVFTFTMPEIATGTSIGTEKDDCLEIAFHTYCSASHLGQQGKTKYDGTVSIAEVQMEEGPQATMFDKRMPQIELGMCQRYFETGYLNQTVFSDSSGDSSNRRNYLFVPYKTKKKEYDWAQDTDLKWDELGVVGGLPMTSNPATDIPPNHGPAQFRHSIGGIDSNNQVSAANVNGGGISGYQPEGFLVNWNSAGSNAWCKLVGTWMVDNELYLGESVV